MHEESGFEDLVRKGTTENALRRFTKLIDWPPHLQVKYPNPELQAVGALRAYFAWAKGSWGIADFLADYSEAEIPERLRQANLKLKNACAPASTNIGGTSPVDASRAPGAD